MTVRLAPLDQAFPQFPSQPPVGRGLKAMRLDVLPAAQFDGRGIRVAVIGSGCHVGHRNLRHVSDGIDLLTSDQSRWKTDELGLGTHCAGIIGAADAGSGVRGIAPRAHIVALKTLGPRVSDVIAALDQCIERDLDIVCVPSGSDRHSVLLDQKVTQATQHGVACIAAAGDTGGAVQYPARSPNVLGVSAIGWRAAFPSDSHHAYAMRDAGATADGYFAAKFSGSGPEVDVCGPGVAVVSSAPPDDFAAWDGTALAAAHVAGLAALILAHHPEFASSTAYARRSSERVVRLFEIIRGSALPFQIDDTDRTGYGLPDAVRALNAASVSGVTDYPNEDNMRTLHSLVEAVHRSRSLQQPNAALEGALARAGLRTGP
jgi:subtilisin